MEPLMSRLTLTVLDGFGMDADVELTFRRDVVEVHYEGRCRAVFRRDVLKEWLTYPEGSVTADDVSFTLSTDGIVLRVEPVVPGCPLAQFMLAELRERVG
jgi:hypothetical protein